MDILEMYPLSLEEFAIANSISSAVLRHIREAFENKTPVDPIIHEKMMKVFHLYLLVGGMPAAVQAYIDTNNIKTVTEIQNSILYLYKKDIAKYDPDNKLYLEEIFECIPGELNAKNKRFILQVLPIEVKSGKSYTRHSALNRVLNAYPNIKEAVVLHVDNVKVENNIRYLPIYMIMYLKKRELPEDFIYSL